MTKNVKPKTPYHKKRKNKYELETKKIHQNKTPENIYSSRCRLLIYLLVAVSDRVLLDTILTSIECETTTMFQVLKCELKPTSK